MGILMGSYLHSKFRGIERSYLCILEELMNAMFYIQFREAANEKDDTALLKVMSLYGMHCL